MAGLNVATSRDDLFEFFKPCGGIMDIKIVTMGKAFVKFETVEAMEKSLELNKAMLFQR